MSLYLSYAVRSDLGLVRGNNEDSVYAGPRLLAVADGMGGHAAGEVASTIVIGSLEPLDEDRRIDDLMGALRDSVIEANRRIADAVKQRKELEGMGTTLTALRFVGSQVGLVHVGDSRAYLLRNDRLAQITHDDTYVQYLVDSGKLTPEEAKDHPRKSVILRALLGTDVEPDVSIREARDGDRYLLCSDGLSDVVSTETILETLRIDDPQEAADRLVELALRGGGPDNVTVIVADVRSARIGEKINDVPIVAGAFVDPAAADVPETDGSSAAERAKALVSKPAPADAEPPTAHRTKRNGRSWRPWALVAGIVVLMLAALGGTYAWAQTQYFIGRADSDVAIYRGVNTEFGPLKFFTVYRVSDLRVDDLYPNVRSQIASGINAGSESDAEKIIRNLRSHVMPLCTTTPAPTTTAPSSPTSTAGSPTNTRSAPRSPSGTGTRSLHAPTRSAHVRHATSAARHTGSAVTRHAASATSRATRQNSKPASPTRSLGVVPSGRHSSGTTKDGSSGSGSRSGSASRSSTSTSVSPPSSAPGSSAGAPCRPTR